MKIKTSITITDSLLTVIDRWCRKSKSRSEFIETAIRSYIEQLSREQLDVRDLGIINDHIDELNEEAADVLDYQASL